MKYGILAVYDGGDVVLTIMVNPDNPAETHIVVAVYGLPSPTMVVKSADLLSILKETPDGEKAAS